jgi:hypothetical protein
MDSASSLAYPGSRVLAGWWRQLQPHQPVGLWVGYLFVHRVEALAECVEPRAIDALALHILRALAIDPGEAGRRELVPDSLPGRLHLPRPAVRQLLAGLQEQDLVQRDEPGFWRLSERGRSVVRDGADLAPRRERRVFTYVERLASAGRRVATPHYLDLLDCPGLPWTVDDAHRFDVALLHESLAQSPEWKARHEFPAGVRAIVAAGADEPDAAWEQVIVNRPERVPIALTTRGTDRAVLGFAARVEGWKLLDEAPVLHLAEAARSVVPELAMAPTAWQDAWRLWCRQRSLPLSEADACRLSFDGIYLDVHAPESFVQRLRVARSELLQEECGLLAGDGYLRAAALLRLKSQPQPH